MPNFLPLVRSGTFQSSSLCAHPRIIRRTLPHHRFCDKFHSASAGFCFFCDFVCRWSAAPRFFYQILIVHPTIVRFLRNSTSAYMQVLYYYVTSLCHFPTSVNLAYLDESSIRSDSVIDRIPYSSFGRIRSVFFIFHSGIDPASVFVLARIRFFGISIKSGSHTMYFCLPKLLNSK